MSGGCILQLGENPRSATLPVGSATSSDRSAVTSTKNFVQSTLGSVVVPFVIAPSLRVGYIVGVAIQATHVRAPLSNAAGSGRLFALSVVA